MSKNQGTRSNTSLENKYRPVSQSFFFKFCDLKRILYNSYIYVVVTLEKKTF